MMIIKTKPNRFIVWIIIRRNSSFNGFISIPITLLVVVLPVSLVYFFFTKFFYTYFFDHRHVLKDIWKSIRHSIYGTVLFVFILMLVYLFLAGGLFNKFTTSYESNLDEYLQDTFTLEQVISKQPIVINQLEVSKELSGMLKDLKKEISLEKNRVESLELNFSTLVNDEYFTVISNNLLLSMYLVAQDQGLINLREGISRKYKTTQRILNSTIPSFDGSAQLDARFSYIKEYVDENYVKYSVDEGLNKILQKFPSGKESHSDFEASGINYIFSEITGNEQLYSADDFVLSGAYNILKHTVLFREFAVFTMNLLVLVGHQTSFPTTIEVLYKNRNITESKISKIVRYELIYAHLINKDKFLLEQRKSLRTLAKT